MPLKFVNNDSIQCATYYPSPSCLNGDGVASTRIAIRVNGQTKYIGLSTDENHMAATDLKINVNGTVYTVLEFANEVIGSISS